MIIVGLWLGILGYGILYAGVVKLGGGKCSIGQAFRGQCVPGAAGGASSPSWTQAGGRASAGLQQLAWRQRLVLPTQPLRASP
jgi:hypothetical protein